MTILDSDAHAEGVLDSDAYVEGVLKGKIVAKDRISYTVIGYAIYYPNFDMTTSYIFVHNVSNNKDRSPVTFWEGQNPKEYLLKSNVIDKLSEPEKITTNQDTIKRINSWRGQCQSIASNLSLEVGDKVTFANSVLIEGKKHTDFTLYSKVGRKPLWLVDNNKLVEIDKWARSVVASLDRSKTNEETKNIGLER